MNPTVVHVQLLSTIIRNNANKNRLYLHEFKM